MSKGKGAITSPGVAVSEAVGAGGAAGAGAGAGVGAGAVAGAVAGAGAGGPVAPASSSSNSSSELSRGRSSRPAWNSSIQVHRELVRAIYQPTKLHTPNS